MEDKRYCEKMYKFMLQVKQNIDCLNVKNHHLVQRKKKYFMQANRSVIEMWQVRLISAIEREKTRRESQKDSIEKYVQRRKSKQMRKVKETRYEPPQKQFKQTLIFSAMKRSEPSSSTPINSPDVGLTRLKRRRLDNLVQRKRKSQTQLNILPDRVLCQPCKKSEK